MSGHRVVRAADARQVRVGPNVITYHAEGGSFSVIDYAVAPRFVAPPVLHWHRDTDFAGYVLEGRLTFRFSDAAEELTAGDTLYVPRDTHFAWSNPSDEPARVLFIYSPAGFEQYFKDVESLVAANPGKSIPDLVPQLMPLWEKYQIASES